MLGHEKVLLLFRMLFTILSRVFKICFWFPLAANNNSLSAMFKKPEGNWECETCMVQNLESAIKCIACESSKPGLQSTNSGLFIYIFLFYLMLIDERILRELVHSLSNFSKLSMTMFLPVRQCFINFVNSRI